MKNTRRKIQRIIQTIRWRNLKISVLTIVLFSVTSTFGENYSYIPLSIQDGLSQVTVNSISQDNDGYMWIGTQDGLNRFDGYRFKHFRHLPDNLSSLSNSYIVDVVVDDENTLWVLTASSLDRFNRKTQTFEHFNFSISENNTYKNMTSLSMFNGQDNNLWISTSKGILEFRKKNHSFHFISSDQSKTLDANRVYAFREFDNKIQLVATDNGLFEKDRKSALFERVKLKELVGREQEPQILCLSNQRFGIHFLCESRGIFVFINQRYFYLTNEELGIASRSHEILISENNDVWIGTLSGLYKKSLAIDNSLIMRLKKQKDAQLISSLEQTLIDKEYVSLEQLNESAELSKMQAYQMHDVRKVVEGLKITLSKRLANNKTLSLYEGRDQTIWVGTNLSGVIRGVPASFAFEHYSHLSPNPHRINNALISSIEESPDGTLWASDTQGNINRVQKDKTVTHLQLVNEQSKPMYPNILDITFDSEDVKWLATAAGVTRINHLDEQTHFELFDENNKKTYATQIFKVKGDIWATGLNSGLLHFNREQQKFVPVTPTNWRADHPFATMVYTALISDNRIWLTGYQGYLFEYDVQSQKGFQHRLTEVNNSRHGLTQAYSMVEDDLGFIWVAGKGGLGKFHPKTSTFTYLSLATGFPSDTFYSVLKDSEGFIWSTPGGKLVRIDPMNYSSVIFDHSVGMPIAEFSPAAMVDSKKRFWLGGVNGLISFDPIQLTMPTSDTSTTLTEIQVKILSDQNDISQWKAFEADIEVSGTHQVDLAQALNEKKHSIVFSSDQRSVKFFYSILNFRENTQIRYRHRLVNYESQWNLSSGDIPHATYRQLPPGDYIFQVSTSFNGVDWSVPESLLTFSVQPTFLQSFWAKFFAVLILFFAIRYAFVLKAQKLKAYNQQLKDEVDLRTKEISALLEQRTRVFTFLTHELKTPLTLIREPLATFRRTDKTKLDQMVFSKQQSFGDSLVATALRNAHKLSSMISSLLSETHSSEQAQRKVIAVHEKLENVFHQLSELADEFDVVFLKGDLMPCWVHATELEIDTILFNLVSNGIKHNFRGGTLTLSCERQQGDIHIVIENTQNRRGGIRSDEQTSIEDSSSTLKANQEAIQLLTDSNDFSESKYNVVFHPLFEGEETSTHNGLPLVQQTVLLLNGQLHLETTSQNNTRITVCLVAAELEESDDVGHGGLNPLVMSHDDGSDSKALLFIVEDNLDLRQYLVQLFEERYSCYSFANAEAALKDAVEHIPDIIISDVMLPGMNGVEFCRKIKNKQATSHIPVLLLTAKSDQASIIEGLKHQATDYVLKPFDSEVLQLKADNLLALTRRRYMDSHSPKVRTQNLQTNAEQLTPQEESLFKTQNIFTDDNINNYEPSKSLGEKDRLFMERFMGVLDDNYSESEFDLDQFAAKMYLSKKQLSRKLKAISGKSPMEFLKTYRLEQSLELLAGGLSLTQIALESGFASQSYFSTCFKQHFGKSPKQLQQSIMREKRQEFKVV